MANTNEVLAAARKLPSQRTAEDNALIASDPNRQSVRNALEESKRAERIHGPSGGKSR